MAEAKAEDDDDEAFGDFTFASFPNQTVNSFQINGKNDDDEWGDFIEYPIRLVHPQSTPNPSGPPNLVDPFGFFSDHSQLSETRIESLPNGVELGKTQWVKPKGALPLSIFGDAVDEEEEKSDVVDPSVGDAKEESFAGNMKSESNVLLGVGINDFISNLYTQRQQINAEDGFNSNSHGSSLNLNGTSLDPSELNSNFDSVPENGLISSSNELHSLSKEPTSNIGGLNPSLNSGVGDEEFDGDDEGWEFRDAYSESKVDNGNDKVQEFSEVPTYPLGSINGSHGSTDLFASPNGFSSESHKMDFGFYFKPSTAAQNGCISDSYFQTEWKDNEIGLHSHPLAESADPDENFGDFEAAISEVGSEHKGNDTTPENRKEAVPLSNFGVEEPQDDDSLDIQHDFVFKPATYPRNVQIQSPKLSISDLLLDLYSQAEPIPSVDSKLKQTENGLDSTDRMFNSNLVGGDDDFDDGSWEFKDALSQSRIENPTPLPSLVDANQNLSTNRKLNDYVDFYSKLKVELLFVARCHLDSLKEAQSTAGLSGENAKVAALDEEIQEACEELCQENIIPKAAHSDEHPPSDICLKEYLETLREQKFQAFESEYGLSRRLTLAVSDLRSAIELIKHSTIMLKILKLVSMKEQADYVSMWSKMISICGQELKHGAWIWKQSFEKNVQSQILSEPRGKQFILALGEIYRAVVLLGASVKFYRPWILSSSVDSTGIYALLEECHTLWSTSGLEEALLNISDPIGSNYKGNIRSLVESIKRIRDLDALALANLVSSQQESICRFSVLTPGVVPEMKMVVWNGENYFLTLANLWANLISCDPPKLPCLHVG